MSDKKETEKQKVLHTLSGMIIWHLDSKAAQIGGEIDGNGPSGARLDRGTRGYRNMLLEIPHLVVDLYP